MTWTYFTEKILLLDPNVMKPAEPRSTAQAKEWLHHGTLGYFFAHMFGYFLPWYAIVLLAAGLVFVWELPEWKERSRSSNPLSRRWYTIDIIQDVLTKMGGVVVGLFI